MTATQEITNTEDVYCGQCSAPVCLVCGEKHMADKHPDFDR